MPSFTPFQRVTALVLAIAVFAPLSASADSRRLSQTDLTKVASEVLNAVRAAQARRNTPASPSRKSEAQHRTTQRSTIRTSNSTAAVTVEGVLDAMNRERQKRRLSPLRLDSRLNAAAFDRMHDMFEQGYFNHVAPDGTQPFVWVKRRNYRYATVGENLADGHRRAQEVVDGWMSSSGHRANILGSSFGDVGIAIVAGSPIRRSNGYTVVALYAREQGKTMIAER